MIDLNIEIIDLSTILKCAENSSARMIKIKAYSIEGCKYCNSQISIRYDIHCLEKPIKNWTNKLCKVSEKCKGNKSDSSFEMI